MHLGGNAWISRLWNQNSDMVTAWTHHSCQTSSLFHSYNESNTGDCEEIQTNNTAADDDWEEERCQQLEWKWGLRPENVWRINKRIQNWVFFHLARIHNARPRRMVPDIKRDKLIKPIQNLDQNVCFSELYKPIKTLGHEWPGFKPAILCFDLKLYSEIKQICSCKKDLNHSGCAFPHKRAIGRDLKFEFILKWIAVLHQFIKQL